MTMAAKKRQTAVRLSDRAMMLLARQAKRLGVSKTAVVEMLIREHCK